MLPQIFFGALYLKHFSEVLKVFLLLIFLYINSVDK